MLLLYKGPLTATWTEDIEEACRSPLYTPEHLRTFLWCERSWCCVFSLSYSHFLAIKPFYPFCLYLPLKVLSLNKSISIFDTGFHCHCWVQPPCVQETKPCCKPVSGRWDDDCIWFKALFLDKSCWRVSFLPYNGLGNRILFALQYASL